MSRPEPRLNVLAGEDSRNLYSLLFHDLGWFTGSQAGAIKEWNLHTLRQQSVLQKSAASSILSLRSCGQAFISREKNGPVLFWEKQESRWISSLLTDQSFGFSNIEVDEVNNDVFVPGEKGSVHMYSLKTRSKIATLKHQMHVMSLKIIRLEGTLYLVSAHENGDVCLWDFKTMKIVSTLKVNHCVTAVDFSNETRRGLCGTVSQNVHVFNIDESQTLSFYKTLEITNEGVECVCVRPDNKIVTLGCWDGAVRVFSWKTLQPLAVKNQFDSCVRDLAFVNHKSLSKDGRYLMVACGDNCVAFWDLYN